jgi:MSHA biogenesis protein MshP
MFQIHKRGFALPAAIFLLVTLSILAVALLKINVYTSKSSTMDILENKAYLAAKVGVEYAAYQAIKNDVCSAVSQTVNIGEQFFDGFKTSYSCQRRVVDEANVSQTYFTITSYGCNTTGASCPEAAGKPTTQDYAEKSISAVFAK